MEKIIDVMQTQTPIMLFILGLMMVAVIVDLVTGIIKAKRKGEATTSSGFRKTCKKLTQYIVPLLAFAVFDLMLCLLPFYEIPYLTLLYGGFCTLTEAKSIYENTHTKEEKLETAESIIGLVDGIDDKKELLKAILKEFMEEENKNKEDK